MTEMTINAPEVVCEPKPEALPPEVEGAINTLNSIKEELAEACEPKKPYEFRKLGAPDVFLMFKIISKIGLNEFMAVLGNGGIVDVVKNMTAEEKNADSGAMVAVAAVALDIAHVILGNIGKCEKEIYQLLSQTSNLSVEEITAEGNAVMFLEMVIDFVQKDEFPDFIKVVSSLFNK